MNYCTPTSQPTRFIFAILALVAVATVLPPASVIGPAQAQEEKKQRKTKKAPAMSEKVYKKLTEAQELIEAKDYNGGLAVLRKLEQMPKLSNYEKAQLYNYFAYTYFTLERYKEAIRSYQKVLQQPDLPEALVQNSLYTIAQLYFITEEYRQAIDAINKWFKITPKPTENAYMLLGQAYYQIEDYKKSLAPLKQAYQLVKARGDKPKENLLLLLRVNYFNLGDYNNMIRVLKEMVALYPKPEYWLTMAGAYSELKRYEKQMSIMEMLYESGNLPRGNQQLNLANLFLLYEVPYKAAKVLDKGMQQGLIEKNVRNLRLLSQAWLQAGESKQSIAPLKQAARMSKDGDLEVRLAQAYINLDQYSNAVAALDRAFKKGGIRRPDQAYVMLGMAEFERQRFDSALRAFGRAAKDKRSRKSAQQWRTYVNSEKNRKKELEEAIKSRGAF